jgi:hypothetical protein
MWPTSARYSEVLTSGSRRWATRVEVLYAGDRVASLDVVLDGSVSVNRTAVRRSLKLTLVDPTGALTPTSARDLLAPKGTELRIWRGLLVDGEYEWVPLGVFGIIDPEVTAHDGGTKIEVKGFDRADAVRLRRFTSPYRVIKGTPTHEAIAAIVTSRLPGVPTRITASGHTTPELLYDRLEDPMKAVDDIANADSVDAYFDPLGTFIVTPRLETETDVVYQPGPQSLLIASSRALLIDNTYSGVIVTGEHPDETPIIVEEWDLDPKSPTYSLGPFGRRPFGYASSVLRTEAQARLAAQTLLKRVTKMRQTAKLVTVGHPGHEIGDIITAIDPDSRTSGRWVIKGIDVPVRSGKIAMTMEEYLSG